MAGLAPAMTMNGTFVPHHALILTPMGTSSDMTIMQRNGAKMTPAAEPAPALSAPLVALLGTRQWLNTPPLRPDDLRGKVVVVNFWTYSCINCLRALPHVRAWARTYGDRGLLVVGVHTPEFAFEKDAGNVRQALAALGVTYPVAIDSDFRIWRAFGNQAWPALYVIGADGRVRHRVLGEGGYDQSERLIRQLLSEAAAAPVSEPLASVAAPGAQAASDAPNLGSGETYIGYAQTTGFASFGGIRQDVPALYRIVPPLAINRWGLAGTWTVGGEFATSNAPAGRIAYRFHARDLHLVLAPAVPNQTMRFRVTLDGAPPGADHGADVDPAGWGSVQDGRLYQLIRQTGPITDRTFEIEFFDAGVRAYAFTFG
jgi:thiol-disulfide isomerase/thioredoxin